VKYLLGKGANEQDVLEGRRKAEKLKKLSGKKK
jgi:hypothetical protein